MLSKADNGRGTSQADGPRLKPPTINDNNNNNKNSSAKALTRKNYEGLLLLLLFGNQFMKYL